MILVDQMRADALGCFSNEVTKTPNLERLAESGTRFAQCMVTQPTCTPSRASLLSGCFPSALRSRMVGYVTPDDSRLLPRVLAGAGYHTAAIDKIHFVPQGAELDAVEATRRADGSFDYYGPMGGRAGAGPGIPVANRVDQISSLVDVAPTLLELIGISEPDALQGFSMCRG